MNKIVKSEERSVAPSFNSDDIKILKDQICRDLSDSELKVFLMFCTRSGLDPFTKEIYAIKRAGRMTIQTSIDGLRLIADRTGCYAPGPEPTFTYDADSRLISATSYVKKMTIDGTWHIVSACAHFSEYAQRGRDGKLCGLWGTMGHCMLSKCAEGLAIRKCFPGRTDKLYLKEEMDQAENPEIYDRSEKMGHERAFELENLLYQCDENYKKWFIDYVSKKFEVEFFKDIPESFYDELRKNLTDRIEKFMEKKRIDEMKKIECDTSFYVDDLEKIETENTGEMQ
jgi:phage recombination protein Bet